MRALFSGFAFTVGDPSVWLLALVPVAVALALTSVLGWVAVAIIPDEIAALLGGHAEGALGVIVKIVAGAVSLIVALLAAFALAQPLSGPALERIVRRVEAQLGGPTWTSTGLLVDMLRSLQSVVVSYAFGLPLLATLFLINVAFPPAAIVTVPLKLAVVSLLLAWDLCDYPLSLRGISVSARVSFIKRHVGATIGFGVGVSLVAAVPCLFLLVLPAGVAGAARLIIQIERWEAAVRAASRPR